MIAKVIRQPKRNAALLHETQMCYNGGPEIYADKYEYYTSVKAVRIA